MFPTMVGFYIKPESGAFALGSGSMSRPICSQLHDFFL